ncbi:MAG: hypothetical protein WKG32_12205 [Gemmatimonadaceae bacterium]
MDRTDNRDDRDEIALDDTARSAGRNLDDMRQTLGANSVPEVTRSKSDPDAPEKAVGAAVGGVSGAAMGAGIGTLVAGPIGTAIGALAGAVGGWWAGHGTTVATDLKADDDEYYRSHYEADESRAADRDYPAARPAYQLGHVARHNPDYTGKAFEEIEDDLQKGWTTDLRTKHGDWSVARRQAQAAYSRNPDFQRESVSERTVISASERARDRLAGGRDGLRSDDTLGY